MTIQYAKYSILLMEIGYDVKRILSNNIINIRTLNIMLVGIHFQVKVMYEI
jgi:hypothetical protein